MIRLAFLIVATVVVLTSCNRGCTESGAINYSESAVVNDGSCQFASRTINFATTSSQGGEIYVELSRDEYDAHSEYYSYSEPGQWFSYDEFDENYPLCGISKLASFNRIISDTLYYDAHDKHGVVWSGITIVEGGECKVVTLDRPNTLYGEILVYSSKQITSPNYVDYRIIVNPKGKNYDEFRTHVLQHVQIYSADIPTCSKPGVAAKLLAKAGDVKLSIRDNNFQTLEVDLKLKGGACVGLDLADYF
jgi:hypothetical protein